LTNDENNGDSRILVSNEIQDGGKGEGLIPESRLGKESMASGRVFGKSKKKTSFTEMLRKSSFIPAHRASGSGRTEPTPGRPSSLSPPSLPLLAAAKKKSGKFDLSSLRRNARALLADAQKLVNGEGVAEGTLGSGKAAHVRLGSKAQGPTKLGAKSRPRGQLHRQPAQSPLSPPSPAQAAHAATVVKSVGELIRERRERRARGETVASSSLRPASARPFDEKEARDAKAIILARLAVEGAEAKVGSTQRMSTN
jgi:hypothetical protein